MSVTRAYLLRRDPPSDYSRSQPRRSNGRTNRLTPEEAEFIPTQYFTSTVGTERDVDVDIFSVELEPGDAVLMCSDGLWGDVELQYPSHHEPLF